MSAKAKQAAVSKPIHLYDSGQRMEALTQNLRLVGGSEVKPAAIAAEEKPSEATKQPEPQVATSWSCSTCGVQFSNVAEQREHFRLDWHRLNVKQRLEGKPAVSQEDFESELERDDEIESISGSESDEDSSSTSSSSEESEAENENSSKARLRTPSLYFTDASDRILSIYRCVLTRSQKDKSEDSELLSRVSASLSRTRWAVFLLGGGHFAGAIFDGASAVVHKTFHCYTVRAKQGGSQGSADNRGGHHKSAGASLRRYNEAALVQHVQDIMQAWSSQLSACHLVFYRAASANKSVLFGGKEPPLSRDDDRLRTIPFPTRRATFNEVKRVHDVLSTVRLYGDRHEFLRREQEELSRKTKPKKSSPAKIRRFKSREASERPLPGAAVQKLPDESDDSDSDVELRLESVTIGTDHLAEFGCSLPPRKPRSNRRRARAPPPPPPSQPEGEKTSEQEERFGAELRNELVTACKSGDTRLLQKCLDAVSELEDAAEGAEQAFVNLQFGANRLSALHLATLEGHRKMVIMLMQCGADPCAKDKSKRPPFALCQDKEMRNAYRAFRAANPDRHDYSASQIPLPPTAEEEARQAAKRKAQRDAKRDREKAEKERTRQEMRDQEERQRFLALSDREKRALAAERRMLDAAGKAEDGADVGGAKAAPVVVARCFECAADISGKVPFEYATNRFCSVKCVKAHRQKK